MNSVSQVPEAAAKGKHYSPSCLHKAFSPNKLQLGVILLSGLGCSDHGGSRGDLEMEKLIQNPFYPPPGTCQKGLWGTSLQGTAADSF